MTADVDPTTKEIIRNLLQDVSTEMQTIVMNSSYAPLWKEGGDFSCAVLNTEGEIVAQSKYVIPVHVTTMGKTVEHMLDDFGGLDQLRPGSVLITNDPYSGNIHLNDVFIAKPIFHDGQPLGFSAVRGHWVDIGETSGVGSTDETIELMEEGIIIPPGRLYKEGERNEELYQVLLANIRDTKERTGDLNAQLAGVDRGEARVTDLVDEYGYETVTATIDSILSQEEARMRRKIADQPDGTYTAVDHLDGDEVHNQEATIQVALEIDGSSIHCDFSGTDRQFTGSLNAAPAITTGITQYACKVAFDPGKPPTSGGFRPISITAPKGTFLNPEYPAPVRQGNTNTAARILDVVIKAIAEINPALAFGAGEGGSPGFTYYSPTDRKKNFIRAPGGLGACQGKDGFTVRSGAGNTSIQSIERLEEDHEFVRTEALEIVTDSGGAGEYRGGCGLRRETHFDNPVRVAINLDRAKSRPYGIAGGLSGSNSDCYYVTPDDRTVAFESSKARQSLPAGSTVVIESPGAGGYGSPADRPPERVLRDVNNGYVSVDEAEAVYRVVFTEDNGELSVDHDATRSLRDET